MPAIAPLATPELASMLDTSEQPQQASFLGTLARTADKAKLALAQAMEVKRASPEEIWRNTGWFRGADTKWRFEIPDTGSKMIKGLPGNDMLYKDLKVPMEQAFQHPELYAAHPELAQIPYGMRMMGKARAAFIPPPKGPIIDTSPLTTMKEKHSDLLHELQHGVQNIENFAKGGNPRLPVDDLMKNAQPLPAGAAAEASGIYGPISDMQYAAYLQGRKWGNFLSKEQYLRQAGEVEARNVQARLRLTPEQLREIPPWVTQSIPNEYQFVNFKLPWEQVPVASYLDTSMLRTRY